MKINQIIKDYSPKLKTSSPILDTEILLSKTLNKPKEYLYTFPEKKLTVTQLAKFKKLFERRLKGEPIAYILGFQEFFNLQFKVNENVLIPRPETEILVEEILKYTKNLSPMPNAKCLIADIGVGSGAIIISLAKTICHPELVLDRLWPRQAEARHSRRIDKCSNMQFYGTDISRKALHIAKQNAKLNKVKTKFLKGNLLEPLFHTSNLSLQRSVIVANLPYLTTKQLNNPQLKNEPKTALDAGTNGLKYYHEFFNQIHKYKIKPQAIFLEIGHNQAKDIKKIAKSILPNYKYKIKKDLCGFDRVLIIQI